MRSADPWVVGVGSSYRFEVRYFDGGVMVVERRIDPFPISSEEVEENRRRTVAMARSRDAQWSWIGADIPDHKPFFDDLHADHSGRVWVRRRGPSTRIDDCDAASATPGGAADAPAPSPRRCWRDESFFDVFGSDGRYLGEVPFPPFFRPFGGGFGNVFMRDDMVLMEVEDDAGTPMVKRYPLVLPGQASR